MAYRVIGEQRASFSRRIVAVAFCLRLYKVFVYTADFCPRQYVYIYIKKYIYIYIYIYIYNIYVYFFIQIFLWIHFYIFMEKCIYGYIYILMRTKVCGINL